MPKFVCDKVEKQCWKRRKCWLPTFSPPPNNVFKIYLSWNCSKSESHYKELTLNEIEDHPKLTAFVYGKTNITQHRKNCGQRRKCWLPAFSSFTTMFSKPSFSGSLKFGIV